MLRGLEVFSHGLPSRFPVNHTGEGSEIDQIPPVIHFPEMLHGEHAEIIDD